MHSQVKTVAWLYTVAGALYLFAALFVARFGSAPDALFRPLSPPLTMAGAVLPMFGAKELLAVLGLASVVIGSGLLRSAPWARTAGLVLAALYVLGPSPAAPGAGLLLGVFAFVVLVLPGTDRLFRREGVEA